SHAGTRPLSLRRRHPSRRRRYGRLRVQRGAGDIAGWEGRKRLVMANSGEPGYDKRKRNALLVLNEELIMGAVEVGRYLVADPEVCFGKLTFKGTRVPVQTVLTFLAMGDSIDDVLKSWPQLKREAVVEAMQLAATTFTDLNKVPAKERNGPVYPG